MKPQQFTTLKPKVVLGIAAHPDDLDFGASGTLARFARDGAEVHYLILTDGSKGTEDDSLTSEQLVQIREKEQREACQVIGGAGVEFLRYPDGMLEVTMELKSDIIKAIRTIKPDVVVTMDPSMIYVAERGFINHPDHRAAGQATLDAVFPLARDHLSFPELYKEGYEPHKTPTVLLINLKEQNFYVDITDTFETKMDALKAHDSQIPSMEHVRNLFGEIGSAMGKNIGVGYAEGFIRIDIR